MGLGIMAREVGVYGLKYLLGRGPLRLSVMARVQAVLAGGFGYADACGYTEDGAGGGVNLRGRGWTSDQRYTVFEVYIVLFAELEFVYWRWILCDLPRSTDYSVIHEVGGIV